MKLIDGSTVPILCDFEGHRVTNTLVLTNEECQKRTGCVSPKRRFTQRMQIPPISQTMITIQSEREVQILVAPRYPNGKRMECIAARGI